MMVMMMIMMEACLFSEQQCVCVFSPWCFCEKMVVQFHKYLPLYLVYKDEPLPKQPKDGIPTGKDCFPPINFQWQAASSREGI